LRWRPEHPEAIAKGAHTFGRCGTEASDWVVCPSPRPHHNGLVSSAGGVDRDESRILSTGFPSSLHQPVNERTTHDPGRGLPLFLEAAPLHLGAFHHVGTPIGAPSPPTGRYPSASLMDVAGMPTIMPCRLDTLTSNNFLEGLKDSIMTMHPSTQSFFIHSLPILALLCILQSVCTYSELPLSRSRSEERTEKEQQHLPGKHIQILL
jgi:hypothetical protein